jgi:hypothetical protein
MKTKILSLLFTFTALSSFAGMPGNSSMLVYTGNGELFSLYLNGVLQNHSPLSSVRIVDLDPSFYSLEVILGSANRAVTGELVLKPSTERIYVIERKYMSPRYDNAGRNYGSTTSYGIRLESEDFLQQPDVIAYNPGFVSCNSPMSLQAFTTLKNKIIAQKVESVKLGIAKKALAGNCLLSTQVAQVTRLFYQESNRLEFAKYAYPYAFDPENYNQVNGSLSLKSSVSKLYDFIEKQTLANRGYSLNGNYNNVNNNPGGGNGNYGNNNSNRNNGRNISMRTSDYEAAKSSIAAKDFESSKLTLARQVSSSNYLTAEQVAGIARLFSFESGKLEFAKYAYARCVDKGNYFRVNDAFEFESSISSLNEYISGK